MHHLSRTDARRVAVRAQLLDAQRPASLLDVVRGLTLLQIDATKAVAPNADLVVWSRLGSAYSTEELEVARDQRILLELGGLIRPAEDIALHRAAMADWPGLDDPPTGWQALRRTWVAQNDACRRDILAHLERHGPSDVGGLPNTCAVPWRSTGWNNDRDVGQLVELMEERGEVAVAARRSGRRVWDLASRVHPDDPLPPPAEALRTRNALRLASLGIARPRGPETRTEPEDVDQAGEPARIDGVRGEWRVDPAYLDGAPFRGRTALVSPLDRLVFDRRRMVDLFEFDYALEMYKPKARRRWGYFALPILHGDRLVGKLDATADRKAGVLRIDAVHEDDAFSRALRAAVDDEIRDLADWLELAVRES